MTDVIHEFVLAPMQNKTLTRIDGELTQKAMKKLEKEMGTNLVNVHCPFGNTKGNGHLGILQPVAIYF